MKKPMTDFSWLAPFNVVRIYEVPPKQSWLKRIYSRLIRAKQTGNVVSQTVLAPTKPKHT